MTRAAHLHVLVASLGSIGTRHLRNLSTLRPSARVTALRRPESAPNASLDKIVTVTSVEEAIALEPTAAILAGPAPTHVPLATALLDAGIPCFIEKPLSHNCEGIQELRAAAARGSASVMVGYNMRFDPSFRALSDELSKDTIGTVYSVRAEVGQYLPSWRPESDYRQGVSAQRELGGGPLLELSHEIDYLYALFGMPVAVTCRGGRYSDLDIDVPDCIEILLEYETPHRMVSIHLDFLQRPASRECKLIGERGIIRWNALDRRILISQIDSGSSAREIILPDSDRNDVYLEELEAFLQMVEKGIASPISLEEGTDVMRIIEAANRSLNDKATISVAPFGGAQ